MKLKKGLVLFFMLFAIMQGEAQGNVSQSYSQHRIPCDSVVYHLNIFNIKNDSLTYNDEIVFDTILPFLNIVFAPACISFKICKFDTIFDYNYYKMENEQFINEKDALLNMVYNPYVINVYWNYASTKETFNGICVPRSKQPAIFIANKADWRTHSYHYFAKQLLRYFGLRNTSSYPGDQELANATNGEFAADSIWDTPADPFFLGNGNAMLMPSLSRRTDSGFHYFYHDSIKDANGDFYNPMINNLMSPQKYKLDIDIYGSKCPILTRGQYQYIVTNERRCRSKRWE